MTVRRRSQSKGPGTAILLALCAGFVLVGATWWWLRSDGGPTEPVFQPSVSQEASSGGGSEVEALELPTLGASDALVRELVEALSSHPTLASWLVSDDLVRWFVVVDVARGLSPSFRVPDGDFASTMALAVENMVSADVPTGTPEIQPSEAIYEFRDIELEARSPLEKHLIHMGPDNAEAVQGKFNELWRAIVAGVQPNIRP